MSTHYRLQPPFLYIAEQQDFSKAWEYFCCKLLNLNYKTNEIYVRNPPEQGVDIFYSSSKTAYQCKSVESGKSSDFNVSHAIDSIRAAKLIQAELGWEKYAICTNVAISGTAESKLKEELPDIKILPLSHWTTICEQHPIEVEANFRRLIEVPRPKALNLAYDSTDEYYPKHLREAAEQNPIDIFLYSNRHDTTYRIQVSENFSCSDLIELLQGFFKLPNAAKISSEDVTATLEHYVVFDGQKLPLPATLKKSGISQGSVITYLTTITWQDTEKKLHGGFYQMMTPDMFKVTTRSFEQRKTQALAKISKKLKECFEHFETSVSKNTYMS